MRCKLVPDEPVFEIITASHTFRAALVAPQHFAAAGWDTNAMRNKQRSCSMLSSKCLPWDLGNRAALPNGNLATSSPLPHQSDLGKHLAP